MSAPQLRAALWEFMIERVEFLHEAMVSTQARPTRKAALAIAAWAQAITSAAHVAASADGRKTRG